jgi:hypothetical protein
MTDRAWIKRAENGSLGEASRLAHVVEKERNLLAQWLQTHRRP